MKLLIFDLDGTLIDSKLDIVRSVNRSFLQFGLSPMPEETIGNEIGRGSEFLFRQLLGESPLLPQLVARFREIYGRHLLDHTLLYPGVLETLSHFRPLPKVIVTNKNQAFADQIVRGLGLSEYFEGVFGSEAFATQKPDPGPIREVCAQWQVPPAESVLVGDSVFDMEAGAAAGACTVGALYGFGHPSHFTGADHRIERADQLIGLFP